MTVGTVVIVGAGPVGLMLACELRIAGVDVVVLERLDEPTRQSRALAISPRSLELLDQRGFLPEFEEQGTRWPLGQFAGLRLDMSVLDGRHPHTLMIVQSRVEAILAGIAAGLGAEIRRGHELVGLEQTGTAVHATVRTGAGEHRVSGDYLVGCDGGKSTVRKAVGIPFPGTAPSIHAILGDVRELDDSFEQRLPLVYPGGLFGIAPLEPGCYRVSTAEYGESGHDDDDPVSLDELNQSIQRVTGQEIRVAEPIWLSRFTDATRQARRYRDGRVFLAGDAAHIHFPLSGQGMNLGLHDAVNLGWKLGAAVHGWAPDGLLDTYHDERHPVGRFVCMNTRAQIALTFPLERVEPLREIFAEVLRDDDMHRHFARIVTGLNVRYDLGADTPPAVGMRVPDLALTAPDGTGRSLAALLHPARGVLLDLSGRKGVLPAAVAGWTDRVDVVEVDPTGELDAVVALVRPDGHLAWTDPDGTDHSGLLAALERWYGAGSRPASRAERVDSVRQPVR